MEASGKVDVKNISDVQKANSSEESGSSSTAQLAIADAAHRALTISGKTDAGSKVSCSQRQEPFSGEHLVIYSD